MTKLKEAYELRAKKVNKIEKVKELKEPKEALEKLHEYAKNGYDSIPNEDKSYFLKCFGIYDRPQTPKQFMIRVRVPYGSLTNKQALKIAELSTKYGKDYIDLTTRQQVELRYLDIENIPTIMQELSKVGISIFQTGVDNFRNILNDPLDGLAFDNILDSRDLYRKIQDIFLHNFDWISALPRKFNTGISGSISNRSNVFAQDCGFALAIKDGEYGYNLYLGGKVGVISRSANMFLRDEEQVLKVFNALIELYREYGFRDNRNKNRLHFLIESVGMETLREALCEKAGFNFEKAGETLCKADFIEPDMGRVKLKDKTYAIHVPIASGVFSGSDLKSLANASKEYGNGELRITIEQSMMLLGVNESKKESVLSHEFFNKYKSLDTPYFNHLIACAGTEHCPFGVIPNKPDAIDMAEILSKEVPLDRSSRVRMYWSACVKGCGIHGLGDIGFEGCKAKVDKKSEYGVHISLGGKLSNESCEGHTVLKAIPIRFAHKFLIPLMSEYKRLKNDGESFESFNDRVLSKHTSASISFTLKLNAYLKEKNIEAHLGFDQINNTGKIEHFEVFEAARRLYHQLLGHEPYSSISFFEQLGKDKLQEPIKTDASIDENISDMLFKMLNHDKNSRALVFSELDEFLRIY